jgi:HlyD family secretion protein
VVSVQTAPVKRVALQRQVTAEAVLYPLNEAAITPKVSAPVRQFYVQRGSQVRRGQLLAVLENRDLTAAEIENQGAYEQAQASYESTTKAGVPEEMQKAELNLKAARQALAAQQKVYESRKQLYQQGALPRKERDQAEVDYIRVRNRYEIAQKHLAALQSVGKEQQLKAAAGQLASAKGKYLGSAALVQYSEIRSPIAGVVADRLLYPGQVAAAGTPLITVMDTSQVVARAHIPQEQAALLKVGNAATITVPGSNEKVPGKVTVVSPALDPNSTTVEVWVQAKNPQQRLRPGSTVQVSMLAGAIPDALVVPAAAVLTGADGSTSVMVVGADGRAHQKPVQVGIRQDGEVEIAKGLSGGETVITTGAYGLPDNTRVQVEASAGSPVRRAEGQDTPGRKPD